MYPPLPYPQNRLKLLIALKTKQAPQAFVMEVLKVTPATAQRILDGKDPWLSQAHKLSTALGSSVKSVWGI